MLGMRFNSKHCGFMAKKQKEKLLLKMRDLERFHKLVFRRLSEMERNDDLKKILARLSKMEGEHAELWQRIVKGKPVQHDDRLTHFKVLLVALARRLIGVALTVKILERVEHDIEEHLDSLITKGGVTKRELMQMAEIDEKDEDEEDPLQKR